MKRHNQSSVSAVNFPKSVKKIFRRVLIIPSLPFVLLFVIIARLIRPIVIIRFRPLHSTRIGHYVGDTETYLCEKEAGLHGKNIFDIFYNVFPVCNQQIKRMWGRVLLVSSFGKVCGRLNEFIFGKEKSNEKIVWYRDIHGLLEHTKPHLYFTSKEEERGRQELAKMGIPQNASFICLFVRDQAYLDSIYPGEWDYHNYRDSNIQNCILAAEELTRRGYYVLRMGAIVREPLKRSNPMIIDYASGFRTDFLDIYLSAKCSFFISSGAGLDAVPMAFRRPIAFINFIPIGHIHSWSSYDLTIPKKLLLRSEKRLLSFRECLKSDIGLFLESRKYEDSGIDLVENTSEEIRDLVIEMDERINRTWAPELDDELLQKRFWSYMQPSFLHGEIRAKVGAKFLRQHKYLLD